MSELQFKVGTILKVDRPGYEALRYRVYAITPKGTPQVMPMQGGQYPKNLRWRPTQKRWFLFDGPVLEAADVTNI